MSASELHTNDTPLSLEALRRFTQQRKSAPSPVEHCELCEMPLAPEHRHLLKLSERTLICACDACSVLFNNEGAGERKYKVVPRRCLALPDFQMADEQWDDLLLPVNMVYIFRSSEAKQAMAFYPSPAGAMESLLRLENWEELVTTNPILDDLETDVEALLINRMSDAREYYIVPIDACYQLVGLIRLSWRGLSGGDAAWTAIADFFTEVRTKAKGSFNARSEL